MDSERTVCSLPPIINGNHSKISVHTRNVFIELTATDKTKLEICNNILVAMFSQYTEEKFTWVEISENCHSFIDIFLVSNPSKSYPSTTINPVKFQTSLRVRRKLKSSTSTSAVIYPSLPKKFVPSLNACPTPPHHLRAHQTSLTYIFHLLAPISYTSVISWKM